MKQPPTCATRELHISMPYGGPFHSSTHKLKTPDSWSEQTLASGTKDIRFYTHKISLELHKWFIIYYIMSVPLLKTTVSSVNYYTIYQ